MRINTITCHNVYNVGASLQAYALATYLTQLGHDVKIIDYKPDYLSGHYRLWGGVSATYNLPVVRILYCIAKFPGRLRHRLGKRKKEFDYFTSQFLPRTKRYCSFEELRNDPPEADVYFAGSDQIWNTLFQNGKDPAFYLNFVPHGCVRASYAASFATDSVEDQWKDSVKQWISQLDYISVRENAGLAILKDLGITNGQQVLDPVFLLERDQWNDLAVQWRSPISEPYVLLYDFDNNKVMADFAARIAGKNHWKVVSVLKNDHIQENFSQEGPIAFLTLIRNAEVVVSNSFHATAFSLIFEKQFWVFGRHEGINTRMKDLVELAGLSDRLIDRQICDSSETTIDYDLVGRKLDVEIVKAKSFIDKVLAGANE